MLHIRLSVLTLVAALTLGLPPQVAAQVNAAAEQELFRLLNQERARAKLPPWALNPQLRAAARAHARLMAEHRGLSHKYATELPLKSDWPQPACALIASQKMSPTAKALLRLTPA